MTPAVLGLALDPGTSCDVQGGACDGEAIGELHWVERLSPRPEDERGMSTAYCAPCRSAGLRFVESLGELVDDLAATPITEPVTLRRAS